MLPLLLALTAPVSAANVGASVALIGVRSSSGERPIHRGLVGWARFDTERAFALEAEFAWGTNQETFLDESLRTHLVRPSLSLSWATGTQRAQVAGSLGVALSVHSGGLDSTVLQVRPGLKTRIGVDMPVGEQWELRWHFGLSSRGFRADAETGLGLGRTL